MGNRRVPKRQKKPSAKALNGDSNPLNLLNLLSLLNLLNSLSANKEDNIKTKKNQ